MVKKGKSESINELLGVKEEHSELKEKIKKIKDQLKIHRKERKLQRSAEASGANTPTAQNTIGNCIKTVPVSVPTEVVSKHKIRVTGTRRKTFKTPSEQADNINIAPQVRLDAEGNIVLDEESTKIAVERPDQRTSREIIHEDDETWIRYVRKRIKRCSWSIEETLRFYQALSIVGTDFSLLRWFLPQYTRNQLKRKFKIEERGNLDLIDHALNRKLSREDGNILKLLPPQPPSDEDD